MKKYLPLRIKNGVISFLIDKKAAIITAVLLFLTALTILVSAGSGDVKVPPLETLKVLFGEGNKFHTLIIEQFRMPRILVALLAGMSLAIAGAILQGIIRNPLASPDIIGLTGGGAVGVVTFLAVFSDENNALTVSINWMPVAAFAGATLIAFLVYLLAWKKGISPFRLVLIGIGLAALAQALTTLMMIIGPIFQASQANIWLTGTVYGANWDQVRTMVPWVAVLSVTTLLVARKLNIQELGDELAVSVGSRVQWERFVLVLLSTALTAGAVAFAGGIGFVGLMSPHIARRMVGSSFGALLPVAALVGGLTVMIADLAGRTLFLPLDVPAGVFTATIGVPYFIYLLFKTKDQ
ncbi:FecCD family ABC transporter permease [Bacillus marinisedimentorum]|uniref:FecCD family ABC transporter permease n=1 Tax=Bacillus marinisedimentorum TaxID=1821260 RepID=UPI0007E12998|nr:iron ABC transporter permease [Bacillus marinisedimentorum]